MADTPHTIPELAGIFMLRDPQWRKKIFTGGLLLLILPIGWPAVLGYRKELIARLLEGTRPVLPEWKGRTWHYVVEGLKAMGVIFGYFLPLYLLLVGVLLANGVTPDEYWLYTALFFALFTIFSTLAFPAAVLYWTLFADSYHLEPVVALILLLSYTIITLFIPAGFLQVSRTGRYLSAFDVGSGVRLIRRHFGEYLRAWYYSSVMSLIGHLAIPFSPWGVVWCYLGIIFAFNSIIGGEGSWFELLQGEEKIVVERMRRGVYRCVDAGGEKVTVLKIASVFVPAPGFIAQRLGIRA
jgi:hypothetical protein